MPLVCVVQSVSNNVATYLSCTASGKGRVTGKFNFGVGTEGGFGGLVVPQMGESARSLVQLLSKSPSELPELTLSGGLRIKIENRLISTPNSKFVDEEGPIFSIRFLEGG